MMVVQFYLTIEVILVQLVKQNEQQIGEPTLLSLDVFLWNVRKVSVSDVSKGTLITRFGDNFQGITKTFQKDELVAKTCERQCSSYCEEH